MILEQLRSLPVLLIRNTLFAVLSFGSQAAPGQGVAVDPMEIVVEENKTTYFTVDNDTDFDYIITSTVISETKDGVDQQEKTSSFFVNPPLRLLKARRDERLALIYLPRKDKKNNKDYYLSVTFVPKVSDKTSTVKVPVILSQQIPITFR
ncbi:fimbria/pilus periplasmic chaperone [Escherichia coli]|uniref:fimbria/pilus periplasmic chaperone n=1 Tax=Escherichia coli TaxID=562 RepID=UPI00180C198D|nr:fimbria/pilus periplasmic chaperone [Escherichia coli]EFH6680915.1 fimbria/pilus periplasmic chaperone [Escherichia coli]EJS1738428.1 molecular chaperone [Escherichia albertii]MCZ8792867.1 fimbria/pilus periplasmic chaperone [Escherichia albertii]